MGAIEVIQASEQANDFSDAAVSAYVVLQSPGRRRLTRVKNPPHATKMTKRIARVEFKRSVILHSVVSNAVTAVR